MTMNHNQYDYLDSGIRPNVLVEVRKHEALGTLLFTSPPLERVVKRLALRQPKWKLVIGTHGLNIDNKRRAFKAHVYQDGEKLGWIGCGFSYNKQAHTVTFDSPALSAERQRRSHTETADENKAVKAIEKNFFPKPRTKILQEQHTAAVDHINSAYREKLSRLVNIEKDLFPGIAKFVLDNIDEFKPPLLTNYNVTEALLTTHAVAKMEEEAGREVREVVRTGVGGLTLYVDDNEYVVLSGDFNNLTHLTNPTVYNSETLPKEYKANLGMLKLIEPANLITGVGARVNVNTYIVMAAKEETDE